MSNAELFVKSCVNNGNTCFINNVNNVNNDVDNIRRDGYCDDKFSDTKKNKDMVFDNDENSKDINVNIYRYKFHDEFTSELFKFSKIHQYDHRKDFKDAWVMWMEENDDIINEEIRRLKNLGYDGSVTDKMFKSARYYFRKKSTEKKAPSERREYVGTSKALLEAMDKHIKSEINNVGYKPSDGFEEFCKKNIDVLNEEVKNLCKNGIKNSVEIKNKVKKTYKNRYFIITTK
jgi:hypothetical protein